MRYADSMCTYEEKFNPHVYVFRGPCVVTNKTVEVTVPAEGLFKYRQGEYMQNAFPNLSAEEREFLISGTSQEGWNTLLNYST